MTLQTELKKKSKSDSAIAKEFWSNPSTMTTIINQNNVIFQVSLIITRKVNVQDLANIQ